MLALLALAGACPKAPPRTEAPAPDTRKAEAHFLSGRFEEGLSTLGAASDPRFDDLAGRCLMGLGRPGEAATRLGRAAANATDPTAAAASRARLARALLEDGRFEEALVQSRRAMDSPHAESAIAMDGFLLTAATAAARAGSWSEAEGLLFQLAARVDGRGREAALSRLAVVARRFFTLQLGVFRSREGADTLARTHGGEVLTEGEVYVVVKGSFESWESARAAADENDAVAVP